LLRQQGENVKLDLVGDGDLRSECESLAKQLGVHEHICFTGVRRDIPALLREWDAFVFSVLPDEGLGIALIEALAAGVPVIASDVGACREVLFSPKDGNLGELFPFGDAEALADAILRFKSNPEPWWNRARLAANSVRQRFSIETMANEYLRLLEND
jgi:glycosyltransferase involved in cell wall biosynthesis